MAKEIKVTFDSGGIFEGVANTFTLNDAVTYYFSFDRDYRVTLTASGDIDTQEYRNNGAWYTIDIITAVTVSDITGGGGDVTKDWVNDNFVKKSGDTMTGPLNFVNSVTGKRTIRINNGNEENIPAQITLYKMGSTHSQIALYSTEEGATKDDYILINYLNIYKKEESTAWAIKTRMQFNNPLYLHTTLYCRTGTDTVNARITDTGLIMTYNGGRFACHKLAMDADPNYWSEYRYDGRTTYSNIGGEDSRYRIVGYNNFADSVECYSMITVKDENADGTHCKMQKDGFRAFDTGNEEGQRVIHNTNGLYCYDTNNNACFAFRVTNCVIPNNKKLYIKKGATNDTCPQLALDYTNISAENLTDTFLNIKSNSGGIQVNTDYGLSVNAKQNINLISERNITLRSGSYDNGYDVYLNNSSFGGINLRTLWDGCNGAFYGDTMLVALNVVLGHVFDKIGSSYYQSFDQGTYSTGGGHSRGGGVGRHG